MKNSPSQTRMFTFSNTLSFIRAPLAFLYLIDNTAIRVLTIVAAMITDSIDGYLARRAKSASRFGAILDPAMDKFFVYFILGVLLFQGKLVLWQACAMISRDFALLIFAFYLLVSRKWNSWEMRAIRWGKITTAFQFLTLIGVTLGVVFPWYFFLIFIALGFLALYELLSNRPKTTQMEKTQDN